MVSCFLSIYVFLGVKDNGVRWGNFGDHGDTGASFCLVLKMAEWDMTDYSFFLESKQINNRHRNIQIITDSLKSKQ